MKKARIILSSILVLAVVVGSFAFNEKKAKFCFYERQSNGASCVLIPGVFENATGTANRTGKTVDQIGVCETTDLPATTTTLNCAAPLTIVAE